MARRSFAVRDIAEILEHWHRGRSIQGVARSLGVDRKTIKKYADLAKAAGFRPKEGSGPPEGWPTWVDRTLPGIRERGRLHPTVRELEGYRKQIEAMLAEVLPTVVWRRLKREKGLEVSLTSFRRYVHRYMPEHLKRPQITVRRPDPPPGEEAQVDYGFLGMWMDPWTGKRCMVHAFTMVLAYSRHLFVRIVFRMDQQAWLECHVAALDFFGGVPRRMVPDNLKTGVLTPDLYDPRFNRSYQELAHHYGFLIDPARAGKPQDKPRVERAIPVVREDFWKGRAFSSLVEMNAGLLTWCRDEAGQRIHGTTRQRPMELFRLVEEKALLPLPDQPFELADWTRAKVARDCHIQVGGAWYSAPYQHVGKMVEVRLTTKLVQCYLDYELIKTHARVPKGRRSTDWADYPPDKAAFFLRTPDWCRRQAAGLGRGVASVVNALLDEHALHHLRQAQGVLRLAEKDGATRLDAACHRALSFGDPAYRTVKTILERGLDARVETIAPAPTLAGAFLRGPQELMASLALSEEARHD